MDFEYCTELTKLGPKEEIAQPAQLQTAVEKVSDSKLGFQIFEYLYVFSALLPSLSLFEYNFKSRRSPDVNFKPV